MSKLIIVPAGDTEAHAADRILGALETSPRITDACVNGQEHPVPEPAREDAVVLVAAAGWTERMTMSDAGALLVRANERGAAVHVALVDGAEAPGMTALPEPFAFLSEATTHDVRHAHWADDVAALIDTLSASMPVVAGPVQALPARQLLFAAGLVGALALLGALLVVSRMWTDTPAVVGSWVAEVDYGRGLVREERFDFRQAGGQITGNATWQGVRRAIEGAVQDGERLSFHTRTHENRGSERRELRLDYVGLVAADSIRFTVRSSGGFEERAPVEFTAQRQQD